MVAGGRALYSSSQPLPVPSAILGQEQLRDACRPRGDAERSQHHPRSLTSLGVGGTACVKRRLQASCDASCFNTSPPKPQNHHKNEKQFQKAVRNRPKSAADPEPPSPWLTPPGMHTSGRRAAALGQRKNYFVLHGLTHRGGKKKSQAITRGLPRSDAFAELSVGTLYSDNTWLRGSL